ncbi:acetyl esterase/lipase [Novosphingobium sp. PhB165]|uniref:alpha/beta hydrolase n=1 Tax=Novosphingobium sp. PhB165 TaxID=2485105 RepID=UPI0010451FE9|nr:alpha/beta hydrolase [Novosphingobium sp. PhB165]TCM20739.1 acetyl esterase/lipase [Novosphingobium sp. PhB165]
MRKSVYIGTLAFTLIGVPSAAQTSPAVRDIPAPNSPPSIPLDGSVAGSADTEVWTRLGTLDVVRNVSHPTLTPILPEPGNATGAAVVIAPGGGMIMLALDAEGWQVAHAFARRGIAAFVLKYRVQPTPVAVPDLLAYFAQLQAKAEKGEATETDSTAAVKDAGTAIAMVRANAARWGVDPARVGMIGFSSGATVARDAAFVNEPGGRPDFVALLYGGLDKVEVPATAPPMFAAVAFDDKIARFDGFPVVAAWHSAGRPVELHAYQSGGHGFGLGRPGTTSLGVFDQLIQWLDIQGFLKRKTEK